MAQQKQNFQINKGKASKTKGSDYDLARQFIESQSKGLKEIYRELFKSFSTRDILEKSKSFSKNAGSGKSIQQILR